MTLIAYEPADYLTFGGNAAQAAIDALTDGIMGCWIRRADYELFISCGFESWLLHHHIDLGGVHTSCAIFARSCWHWAGRKAKRASHISEPIANGWLEGLDFKAEHGWIPASSGQKPDIGDIIYRSADRSLRAPDGHVEVAVERMSNGLYRCAAGGGSPTSAECAAAKLNVARIKQTNGTLCRMTPPEGKDVFARDSLGRVPQGWWSAQAVASNEGLA